MRESGIGFTKSPVPTGEFKSAAERLLQSNPTDRCASDPPYASDLITEKLNQQWRIQMTVDTLDSLFVSELKDLYSAENQITKALPKLIKAASSEDLRGAFEHHLKETQGHVQRLEKVFQILGSSPRGKTCNGMKGVLEEGAEVLDETAEGSVRDAALISAAQRVEHYEMAGYGTVRSYAEILGQSEISEILEETLEEERAADQKLTEISHKLNSEAQQGAHVQHAAR
jgi:ferritin-like metal-binding protein YciE